MTLNPKMSLAQRDKVTESCVIVVLKETYLKIWRKENSSGVKVKKKRESHFDPGEKDGERHDVIELQLPIGEKFEIGERIFFT